MCGRYTKEFTDHIANYHEHLRDFLDGLDAVSQYNVAPATTQSIRCADGQQMIVGDAKWGLIPFWSKDGKGYQINARSETVLEKPMFTQAFARRRCVTWATGYYEWQIGKWWQAAVLHSPRRSPTIFLLRHLGNMDQSRIKTDGHNVCDDDDKPS